MAIPIRIKRGQGVPDSLLRGELAYDEIDRRLFIGEGTSGNDAEGRPIAAVVRDITPGISSVALADLDGVNIAGAGPGDVLAYDDATSLWVAQAVSASSVAWEDITSKPASFTPDTHAISHHTGGGDAIAPADIGAAPAGHLHDASTISGLSTVATTGSYSDLTNKPVLGTAAALDSTAFADTDHAHVWSDITSGVPSTFAPSAHSHAVTLEISGFIEEPEAKTYVISPSLPAAITITQFHAQTSAGTVDLAVHDDGTPVAGCSLAAAGTSRASLASAISESVAAGSKLAIVVSDLQTSPADLAFTIHYTVQASNN
jgi:hypothetical protein